MTTFLLIRHGLTDAVGHRITGHLPGVPLNSTGRSQAAGLPQRLSSFSLGAIYSSPLERARETAAPLAAKLGLPVNVEGAFAEFDFGTWSGVLLSELETRPDWQTFNRFRSATQAPGGETMTAVQTRMARGLNQLAARHPEQTVAVFSHADAIKALLLLYLGAPIDHMHRVEVHPASVSIVQLHAWGPLITGFNLGA